MAKNISEAFKESYYARQSGSDVALILVDIDHASFTGPIRLVNNLESVTHNGNVYNPVYFEVKLPHDDSEIPVAQFIVDNVDRVIVATLRGIDQAPPNEPPTVVFRVIRTTAPNIAEVQTQGMTWRAGEWSVMKVKGSITGPPILRRRYPHWQQTPLTAPGVFTSRVPG